MLEKIKQHPYLLGGVAIIAILVVMRLNSGNASADTTGSSGDVSAAEQWQAAQLSANTQTAQYQTAYQAQVENDATQVALAKIQADTSTNANQLAADVASQQINAAEQTATYHDTMVAQVNENQLAAQTQQLSISTGAQTQQLSTVVNGLVQMNTNQANVAQAQIAASEAVQTQSWVSKIFG